MQVYSASFMGCYEIMPQTGLRYGRECANDLCEYAISETGLLPPHGAAGCAAWYNVGHSQQRDICYRFQICLITHRILQTMWAALPADLA